MICNCWPVRKEGTVGEKDKAQKILESYNEVFADIVNVLLFGGKRIISEDDLDDDTPFGYYKAADEIREQARDIAKRWMNGRIRIASYGLENQTQTDRNMPVRVLSYDAADYQAQILQNESADLYPIVTLVLYYGYERRWSGPRQLIDRLTIPPAMRLFVFNYGMHLFELAYLTREQVDMFQSDFWIVADYLWQKCHNQYYQPNRQTIRHVREILQLLRVMENDNRFETIYNESIMDNQVGKGAIRNMCDVLDQAENRGIERGVLMEREKVVRDLYTNHFSVDNIAQGLNMPLETVCSMLRQQGLLS